MSSPSLHASPTERVIDVRSDGPAILRGGSSRSITDDETDARDDDEDESLDADAEEDADGSGLTDLELTEHEYRRGRQAVPMQSPGDEMELDMDDGGGAERRRRRTRLPTLHVKRQFFEGDEIPSQEFGRVGSRGRILQRIAFRRRKRGEDDTFWMGIFISNVVSLAVMCVLVIYLTQTDFFESHQSDLFGTTVDERFTVVSPESSDAKIYMKTGYSTSRYSEAMFAFGNGELKIGRRALSPTDTQPFYGVSLASNGTATFTNKIHTPLIKSDYVYASRALVFEDGSSMTTAANLTGGISEIGDLNVVSKTGSISLSAGGKRVLVIDPDATVNLLNNEAEDPEGKGIVVDAAKGDVTISETFQIHHDQHSTVISSRNALRFNSTRLVVGAVNSSRVLLTCPSPSEGKSAKTAWAYKPMAFAIIGQSSDNQSRGGNIEISGGDGFSRGGDVLINGGVSTDSDDDDVSRGSVLINSRVDRTDKSITEIGSHSASHQVNLHGSVTINNGTESGHGTHLFIGGSSMLVKSKNVTIDSAASNVSSFIVKSKTISLGVAAKSSQAKNYTDSALIALEHSGTIELNATGGITLRTTSANASTMFFGKVQFGGDTVEEDAGSAVADVTIDEGVVAIDAETLSVGAAGATEHVSVKANRIHLGNASLKSNVTIAGETARISSKHVHVGSTASRVDVTGHDVAVEAGASVRITGGNKSTVSLEAGSLSLNGGKVRIGEASSSIDIGAASTETVSIASTSIAIGASTKSAIKIGSANSAIEILGKVTVNGHAYDSRRQLQPKESRAYGFAESTSVSESVPTAKNEIHISVKLGFLSSSDFANVVDGNLHILTSSVTASISHLRMGLSLDNVRLALPSESSTASAPSRIRCRVYKAGETSTVALELVSQLDSCSSREECDAGFFLGASGERIVSVQAGDSFSVRCAVPSTVQPAPTLLIDRVQLDFSSSI